jgi:hypothetical protein
VLLLRYIDEDLYRQFHLNEPWDSPHNQKLLNRMPDLYRLPHDTRTPAHLTYYQVFVGPGSAFERDGLRLSADFPDGTRFTILVAEAAHPVPWTQPADLVFDPTGPLPDLGADIPGSQFRRRRKDDFAILLADGSSRWMYPNPPPSDFRAAITRNGGDKPDW